VGHEACGETKRDPFPWAAVIYTKSFQHSRLRARGRDLRRSLLPRLKPVPSLAQQDAPVLESG
jgi:hypothetical protein